MECMGALELVKAALVHVQFETVHPFLDGSGRLGRLLITFLLCVAGAIREPILYLSLYFKTNRQKYYEIARPRPYPRRLGELARIFPNRRQRNRPAGSRYIDGDTLVEKDRPGSRSLAAPLPLFCAFTSTFSASRSSRSQRQPNDSPSLRPLWRRLCSTW
jgi:Fic/DOC family